MEIVCDGFLPDGKVVSPCHLPPVCAHQFMDNPVMFFFAPFSVATPEFQCKLLCELR